MFYDYIYDLCAEHGISVTRLLREIGVSASSASRWKTLEYSPSKDTMKRIADYFGMTVSQLTTESTQKASDEKPEADDEIKQILQEFRDSPELKTLFSLSRKATPDELRQYIDVIKALRGSGG